MFQYKRVFLFIPLYILIPAFCLVGLLEMLEALNLHQNNLVYFSSLYTLSAASSFTIIWWFARGLKCKPYQHGFVLHVCSLVISTVVLSIVLGQLYSSPTFFIDTLISIVVLLLATKVGYKKKDVLSNVS